MTEGTIVDVNTMYGVTSLSELTRDEGAIINQLINIVLVPKRTRKFRPAFGSTLTDFLGKPVHPNTARAIRDALHLDLKKYQPYAKINVTDIQVNLHPTIMGYTLKISYTSLVSGARNTVNIDLPAG